MVLYTSIQNQKSDRQSQVEKNYYERFLIAEILYQNEQQFLRQPINTHIFGGQ